MSTDPESTEAPVPPAEPQPDREAGRPQAWPDDRAGREPGDLVAGLSPRQIIGGFALLAGLILMLRRRRRRKD